MKKWIAAWAMLPVLVAWGQAPENLVVEGIPAFPAEVIEEGSRYLEFRSASFQSWHPEREEMLITTRFGETPQLHLVSRPGGARRQLTFLAERVLSGAFQPKHGKYIVFAQDTGGGEFFQLYRYDLEDGGITLLTDGQSRNTGARWADSGKQLAFSSTRRNGRDTDIYIMNPAEKESAKLVLKVEGGGWSVADWSGDENRLLVQEYVSINESRLWLVDIKAGSKELLTPPTAEKTAYSGAQFSEDGRSIFVASDKGSEFRALGRIDLQTKEFKPLTAHLKHDVEQFDLSSDGKVLAFTTNEDGISVLRLIQANSGKEEATPKLPKGVISGLEWHDQEPVLGFSLASARTAGDAYSYRVKGRKLERWTESETSGLNPEGFPEPELARMKSFDGLEISAFVYRPSPSRFPGKRPVLVLIHGGPEGQSRPGFMARYNYFMEEMGIALIVPNVRGSSGYGKTFLQLDNGFKREDSVRDIGTVLDWVGEQKDLDAGRVAVIGGSYGGYMVLASMIHHADRLRAGIDIVGISNFLTFLKNTQDYRRDLRRVEYGDERDEKMREFLHQISPSNMAERIKDPLLVIQGKNDPRVPLSESEQMVKAVRANGGQVWYLMAADEGHGFVKKRNQDFQFFTTIVFLQEFLLRGGTIEQWMPRL